MTEKMKHDPKFATSPIFVTDKDYQFAIGYNSYSRVWSFP